MANIIVSLIIAGALFLAIRKIFLDRKKGIKCTGCPSAGQCGSHCN